MSIQLLATDMDDTLLRADGTLSKRNQEALAAVARRGIKVVLASGRRPRSMQATYEKIGMPMPLVALNGAVALDDRGQTIYERLIEPELAKEVVRYARKMDKYCQIFQDDDYFFQEHCKWSACYKSVGSHGGQAVGPLDEFIQGGVQNILIHDTAQVIENLLPLASAEFKNRLLVLISRPVYLEFNHLEANKGDALAAVCAHYGIERNSVMACGDALNDETMIRFAGIGVAVGNARKELRDIADYIAPTVDEDGFAVAVEKFILNT